MTFLSAIESLSNGRVRLGLIKQEEGAEWFTNDMTPDQAERMAKKLLEAAAKARRHIEDNDISGDHFDEWIPKPEKKRKTINMDLLAKF